MEKIEQLITKSKVSPVRAGVELSKLFDDAFARGDMAFVKDALEQLDPKEVHGDTMVIVLSGIRAHVHKSREIFDAYTKSLNFVIFELSRTWGWSEEDVDDAFETLLEDDRKFPPTFIKRLTEELEKNPDLEASSLSTFQDGFSTGKGDD